MDKALSDAIVNDLFNELRWLLCAATEWDAYDKLIGKPPQVPKIKEPCFHLKVYTMDSAFLHARSLYEFFTATKHSNTRIDWRRFSLNAGQQSVKYNQFIKPLHGRAMHLGENRPLCDAIKNEVVNFATDILDLWTQFSKNPDLSPYAALLDKCRKQSIEEAERVAEQYKEYAFKSPFA